MEAIKKLKETAEACLKELRTIESKVSMTESTLSGLEEKRQMLMAAVTDLEAKKQAIVDIVNTTELKANKGIEEKWRFLKEAEELFQADKAALRALVFQTNADKENAKRIKEQYENLFAEYTEKVKELQEKRQAVLEVLK